MLFSTRVLAVAVIWAFTGCSSSHLADDGAVPPGTDAGPVVLMDSGLPPPTPTDAGLPPTPGDAGPPPVLDAGPPPVLDAGPPVLDAALPPDLDAGPPTALDAGPPAMSDSGTPPGVMCGAMMCGAGEICCATFSGGALMQTCTAPGACMGATLTCDGPEDCSGGEVCCASGGGGGGGTSCRSATGCMFRLCRTAGDCPSGNMCCPFMGSGVCSSFGCFGGP